MNSSNALANKRFTIIADILPVLDDKKALGKAISRAALEYGISKPTVRRYLKLYQEDGKEGLCPKDRTQSSKNKSIGDEETCDSTFSATIRWGLN